MHRTLCRSIVLFYCAAVLASTFDDSFKDYAKCVSKPNSDVCNVFLLGVNPSLLNIYKLNQKGNFTCDGNRELPLSALNDKYCDCDDGTDEPGTQYCPNGFFYCVNNPHQPLSISSSHVNDGICDCCDGTDENDGRFTCPNVCKEKYKEYQKRQEANAKILDEAREIYKNYKDSGIALFTQAGNQVLENEPRVKELQAARDKLKEVVDNLEKVNSVAVENARSDLCSENNVQQLTTALAEISDSLSVHNEGGANSVTGASEFIQKIEKSLNEIKENSAFKKYQENKKVKCANKNFDTATLSSVGFLNRIRNAYIALVKPHQYHLVSSVKIELEEKQNELSKLQTEVKNLESTLEKNKKLSNLRVGNAAFLHLHDKCIEFAAPKYTYSLCLFNEIIQKDLNSNGKTVLGKWSNSNSLKINEANENEFVWVFDNGYSCHNSIVRSTRVSVTCSNKERIISVSEPQMCTYFLRFETPAACGNDGLISTSPNKKHEPGKNINKGENYDILHGPVFGEEV